MKPKSIKRLLSVAVLASMTACTVIGPPRAYYSLSYKADDVPGVRILDYQYRRGASVVWGVSAEIKAQKGYEGVGGFGIAGRLPIGDSLYVKWRAEGSGEVREDSVTLSNLLPVDMEQKQLFFIVDPARVNIYVAEKSTNPQPRCSGLRQMARHTLEADVRARATYCEYKINKIYPVQKLLLN